MRGQVLYLREPLKARTGRELVGWGLLSHGVQCGEPARRLLSSSGLGCLAILPSREDCEPGCAGGLWWCGDSQGSACSLQGQAWGVPAEGVVNTTAPSRTRCPELLEPRPRPAWTTTWCPSSALCLKAAPSWTAALEAFFPQAPKGRISGLPTTSGGKCFQLWALGLFCTERHLAKRLKNNSFYPFTQQQPNVFVLEYYLDTLWKGALLFVVCLFLVSFAYGSCFFQLVLCGHKLEPLVLVQLSERYEQTEYLGRHIARKLNINYFDYLATSYRHVVRHWPLGATFSPGIVQRKTGPSGKRISQQDLDV
ncbi:transmembrane protein 249 [Mirounga leonina]|uniref:transmembrane protein 249 n=1 Tax=Mirounga leonina TaxID=9715 RepID=UPI00156BEB1D|nr:transmembrane protein 249 [Mirounga leonina]